MKSAKRSVSARPTVSALESLEGRVLFQTSPSVSSVLADNRGEVTITLNEAVKPSTVNTNTIKLFTASSGSDFNVQRPINITYSRGSDQITIQSKAPFTQLPLYEVTLDGSTIVGNGANNASHLIGGGPDVTGTAGGQYAFVTSVDSTNIALFQTSLGNMQVQLQSATSMPRTIKNFLSFVNSGAYDGTFIHRLTNLVTDGIGVIQGGGFNLTGNTPGVIPTPRHAIPLEAGISNTIGTIAMARQSAPNSATDQFFFNYADNSTLDEPATGGSAPTSGYAAFGTITSAAGLQTLSALSNLSTVDLTSFANNSNGQIYGALNTLPVLTPGLTPTQVNSDLAANLVEITRVTMEVTVSALPGATPAAVVAGNNAAPSVFADSATIGGADANKLLALLNGGNQSIL